MAQCSATSKQTGEQCQRVASPGAAVCVSHGAGAPQVKRSARRRLQQEKLQRQLVDLLEDLDIDRGERTAADVLASAVGTADDMAAALEVIVHQLGLIPSTEGAGDGEAREASRDDRAAAKIATLFGPDHLGDGAAHVAAEMLLRWNDQRARLSKVALDAGIDEHRARMAGEVAEQLQEVLQASIGAMRALVAGALPPDVRDVVLRLWDEQQPAILGHHIARVVMPELDALALPVVGLANGSAAREARDGGDR